MSQPFAQQADGDVAAVFLGRQTHLLVVVQPQHAEDEALELGEPHPLRAGFVNRPPEPQRGIEIEAPAADAQIGINQVAEAFGEAPVRIRLERRTRCQDFAPEQTRHDALKPLLLGGFEPRVVLEEIHG
jgi:hypothetical protein